MLDIGVDVGGTFTDFTFFDHDGGRLWVKKVSSTPGDPAQGVLNGLADTDMGQIQSIVHGTTVAINAIIQGHGAKTALITTPGFRDHIEIGDTRRYTGGLFDHRWIRTRPPIPHALRFCVGERVSPLGEVEMAVSDEDLERVAVELEAAAVESVAICFLNSYLNDSNEARTAEFLAERLPGVRLAPSSVSPEFREYPRFITAIFNAVVGPLIGDYIDRLSAGLHDLGYDGDVLYMTSAGGILTADAILREPLRLLFGAIAGGVSAGGYLSGLTDTPDLVTFDMGGTSTDVGFVDDYRTHVTDSRVLGAFPIALPNVDVRSIGAGGGSIAWIGDDGALKVGPQSAGARPGPVSYGRGGAEFTVTDAHLVLGRIGADAVLAGEVRLDRDAARKVGEKLATEIGVADLHELAEGVLRVCDTNMYGAIREVSIERGEDPQDLTLVAFGGAGGLHAIPLAERLSMPRVIVPRNAGIFSALGLLVADRRLDHVRHYLSSLRSADLAEILARLGELHDAGRRELLEEGLDADRVETTYRIGMRYQGQTSEEEVIFSELDFDLERLGAEFGDLYERKYQFRRPPESSEIVNLRVVTVGRTQKPDLRRPRVDAPSENGDAPTTTARSREVYFDGTFHTCVIHDRNLLMPGEAIEGPAIVEEYDSTIVVFPGWRAEVDEYADLVMEKSA